MNDFVARLEKGAAYERRFIAMLQSNNWTVFAPTLARLLPEGESHPKIQSPLGSFIAPDVLAWPPECGAGPLLFEIRMKAAPWDGGYPLNAQARGRADRWLPLKGAQAACGGVCVTIADQQARQWRIAPVSRLINYVHRSGDFWLLPVCAFDPVAVLFKPNARERFIREAYQNEDEWEF
jgi:hypothetical protein